ncbi:MAG: hypothetical protein Q8O67_13710 [Deltaproteobacteria bacterium]|nr:hypothetical protein [Deltaproteobacteria bacterium]
MTSPLSALLPALLLTTLGVACAPTDTTIETVFDPCVPLRIDASQLSDSQARSVGNAVTMWNRKAGALLSLATGADDAADVPLIPVVFQKAAAAFHGLYDDEAGVVYINDGIDDDHPRSVTVAHELGHAFGLLHVNKDDDKSVMNDGNLQTEPNDFDVDTLASIWGRCPAPL